jgi:RND family efflux transporter MFP subunit
LTLSKAALLAATISLGICAVAHAAPSVLVQTLAPKRGGAAQVLTAYGAATPASTAARTLSLPQAGEVTDVLVTPGARVAAGQRLLDFATAPAAVSSYKQAVSALALARSERTHTAQLLAGQLATRDQLAQADKAVADAQAAITALRQDGADRATRSLTAPFDAMVMTVPVAAGDRTAPGAALVTLAKASGLVVTAGVEPKDVRRIRPGAPARLTDLAGGAQFSGRVVRVDGVLNPRTRLVDVDIAVPAGAAISGQAFRADLVIGQAQGWLLPHAAVLADDHGTYVFQVAGDKAVRVGVRVIQTSGGTDLVDGPLDPQRRLVAAGAYQLQDGVLVRTSNRR